jgi:hypothetical protein
MAGDERGRHADLLQQAGRLLAGQVAQRVDAHPDSGAGVSVHQPGQVGVGVAQVRGVHVAGADGGAGRLHPGSPTVRGVLAV